MAESAGRVIAVVGARGGVGATTIAVNLAWMLAHEQGLRVALVDLDLFFGSCGLTLDLEAGRGFREALENPSRIDGLFIERAMVRADDNLFVLSAEEALDYAITFDPSAIELLIEHLRRDFQAVVVDLPRFAARSQTAMLMPPSSIVLVSEPSLAGMRDTQRLVKLFANGAPKAELSIVLNRVGANKGAELSRGDFEAGAESKAGYCGAVRAEDIGGDGRHRQAAGQDRQRIEDDPHHARAEHRGSRQPPAGGQGAVLAAVAVVPGRGQGLRRCSVADPKQRRSAAAVAFAARTRRASCDERNPAQAGPMSAAARLGRRTNRTARSETSAEDERRAQSADLIEKIDLDAVVQKMLPAARQRI